MIGKKDSPPFGRPEQLLRMFDLFYNIHSSTCFFHSGCSVLFSSWLATEGDAGEQLIDHSSVRWLCCKLFVVLLLEETAGSCALCQIKSHRQANKIKQCRQPLWFSCDIAGAVQYIYLLIFNFVYKSIWINLQCERYKSFYQFLVLSYYQVLFDSFNLI